MIQINKQINDLFGLGQCAYMKLNDNKKRETIEKLVQVPLVVYVVLQRLS